MASQLSSNMFPKCKQDLHILAAGQDKELLCWIRYLTIPTKSVMENVLMICIPPVSKRATSSAPQTTGTKLLYVITSWG